MSQGFRKSALLALGIGLLASIASLAEDKKEAPALLKAPFTEKEAKDAQEAWAKHLGRKVEEEVDLGGGVKLVLVLIPPSTFTMGWPKGEEGSFANDVAHTVTITKPFYIGKYAVTQEQYKKVVGKNPSFFQPDCDAVKGLDTTQFPVEKVTWEDAKAFCETAKKPAWGQWQLPSEAQWEYACRAGTETPFHFGKELNGNQANCNGGAPYGTKTKGPCLYRPCPVRSYKPNGFGLYQMHGNVQQWCADYYDDKYYLNSPINDAFNDKKGRSCSPYGADFGDCRVLRGGSCFEHADRCQAAFRTGAPALDCRNCIGFRVSVRLD
jgi:formylglycine-generating enzyme required for sulfatase activity